MKIDRMKIDPLNQMFGFNWILILPGSESSSNGRKHTHTEEKKTILDWITFSTKCVNVGLTSSSTPMSHANIVAAASVEGKSPMLRGDHRT